MGTAARLAGMLVFALFVSVIALRPLVSNPAIASAVRDGPVGWGALAVAPLVLVALLVVALRVRSLTDDSTQPHEERYSVATTERGESFWEARKREAPDGDRPDNSGGDPPTGGADGGDEAGTMGDSEADSAQPQDRPNILRGQGGARERDFEIEEQPPDAMLRDHLDHLRAELADDETVARDLETLEEVAREVGGDRTIPARCPQDHCEAVWTGRTVLGVGSGRYEVLEDGKRVQCLECEAVVTLE